MKQNSFSTPVLISFSELAWIAVLAVALLYSLYVGESDRKLKELQVQTDKLLGQLRSVAQERNNALAMIGGLSQEKDDIAQKFKTVEEQFISIKKKALSTDKARMELEEILAQMKQDHKNNIDKKDEITQEKVEAIKNAMFTRKSAERQIQELKEEVNELKAKLANAVKVESSIRKELVSLKGKLDRVIFVLDCSGSMRVSGRWNDACEIVKTWLQHLSVRECALVTFSDDAEVFPPKDKGKKHFEFLNMVGKQGEGNRRYLLGCLSKVKNEVKGVGYTNTLAALQKAYEYDQVSMIILFTDGAPTRKFSLESIFRKRMKDEILELVRKNDIPINIVGLGDYFDKELGSFLLQLAKETGGTFVGR